TFHQKISGAFTGSLPQFGGAGRPFAATRDLTGSGRGPPVPGVPGGPGGRFARCEETRTPRLASFPAADTGPPARPTDRRRWVFWRSPPVPSATRRRLPGSAGVSVHVPVPLSPGPAGEERWPGDD